MNVEISPATRDFVQVHGLLITNADGTTRVPTTVHVALLAPGTDLVADTTWIATTAAEDGTPQFLVAGPAADPSNAYVLAAAREVYARVSEGGLVLTAKLGTIKLK